MAKSERLPELKKEFPFLVKSDKFALESALEHVDRAYQNFFAKRAEFPKFASKWKPSGNAYTTKQTNNNIHLETVDGLPYVKLPKVGLVRIVLPKGQTIPTLVPREVSILSATVKRETLRYTVSLALETVVSSPDQVSQMSVQDVIAADMGVKFFAVIGGEDWEEEVPNPRWIRLHEKRLRRFQKSLSRKQYDQNTHTGSKNWEKAKRRVAAEQRKIKNQRRDFQHKLSRRIADGCSAFCCEDLNIKGMVKNRHLSKAISSVAWGQFLTMLKYKLERQGKHFIKVSRWFPSSQTCNCCGYKNKEVKDMNVREWRCPQCGTFHDRDVNAKDNILREGIRLLEEKGVRVAM